MHETTLTYLRCRRALIQAVKDPSFPEESYNAAVNAAIAWRDAGFPDCDADSEADVGAAALDVAERS